RWSRSPRLWRSSTASRASVWCSVSRPLRPAPSSRRRPRGRCRERAKPMSPRVPPSAARGDDAISASVLAHQPELLAAFQRLCAPLWSHGVLDQPTKEVARLRNARVTGCGYCRNVRFDGAREQGLSEDLVALIDDGYAASDLSERHKAAIRFTDA